MNKKPQVPLRPSGQYSKVGVENIPRSRVNKPPLEVQRARNQIARKQFLKSMGFIANRTPPIWDWSLGDDSGTVTAFTRSEAKARIKESLNLSKSKRLPKETIITIQEVV